MCQGRAGRTGDPHPRIEAAWSVLPPGPTVGLVLAVHDYRRRAWSVKLSFVAAGLLTLYGAIARGQVLAFIIGLVLTGCGVGTARRVERVETDIVVRRAFVRVRRLPAHRCAFGYRWQPVARSVLFWVYVTDGTTTIDVASFLLVGWAERAAARLESTLLDGHDGGAARARVEADRAAHRAAVELGRANVDEYYRSRRHRLTVAVLIVGTLIYSVIGFLFWDH
jgi:hypothetical protein